MLIHRPEDQPRTCDNCRHLSCGIYYDGAVSRKVACYSLSCGKGHRLLSKEDLVEKRFGFTELARELYEEHLCLHSPHYTPGEDDPQSVVLYTTRDGLTGEGGYGDAMYGRTDCPDWCEQA